MSDRTFRTQHSSPAAWRKVLVLALSYISLVTLLPLSSQAKDEAESFDVTFDYVTRHEKYSLSAAVFPRELTVTTLPADEVNLLRLTIALALPSADAEPQNLRVTAISKSGQEFEGTSTFVIDKTHPASKIARITGEFAVAKAMVERVRIRHMKPAADRPMRVEWYSVEDRDEFFGCWGDVNDPDEDCKIAVTDSKLGMTLSGDKCHDLNPMRRRNAPFALNQLFGDFTYSVKVTGDFTPGKNSTDDSVVPFNGAGILCWASEENYLRVERNAFRMEKTGLHCFSPLIEWFRKDKDMGFNTDVVGSEFFKSRSTWLKVNRKANQVAVWISHDGKEWLEVKSFSAELPEELFVGVGAINTSDAAMTVEFEEQSLIADRLVVPALYLDHSTGGKRDQAVEEKN